MLKKFISGLNNKEPSKDISQDDLKFKLKLITSKKKYQLK